MSKRSGGGGGVEKDSLIRKEVEDEVSITRLILKR